LFGMLRAYFIPIRIRVIAPVRHVGFVLARFAGALLVTRAMFVVPAFNNNVVILRRGETAASGGSIFRFDIKWVTRIALYRATG